MADISETKKATTRASVWVRVTAIATVVIAVTGLCALGFAWRQIREMRSEAQIQHLTALVDKLDSAEWLSISKSLAEKRVDLSLKRLRPLDANDAPVELYDELDFCEDVSLLTERGYLNIHDVWIEFSDWLFYLYADAHPVVDADRKRDPAEYQECSNLVEKLRIIEEKNDAGADDHPSEDDIYQSYLGDMERQPGEPTSRAKRPKKH